MVPINIGSLKNQTPCRHCGALLWPTETSNVCINTVRVSVIAPVVPEVPAVLTTMILSTLSVLLLSSLVLSAPRQSSRREEKPGYLAWYSRLYNLNYLPPDHQVAAWTNPWTFSPSFPPAATSPSMQEVDQVEKRSGYPGPHFRLQKQS